MRKLRWSSTTIKHRLPLNRIVWSRRPWKVTFTIQDLSGVLHAPSTVS